MNSYVGSSQCFNPQHPKDPSYYPLLAHLAQTGRILRLKSIGYWSRAQ